MMEIKFSKSRKSIFCHEHENLMKVLLENSVPVASSCHGEGVCGKCKIRIVNGAENLSKSTGLEEFLVEKYNLEKNFRISCQTLIQGNIEIDTSYW